MGTSYGISCRECNYKKTFMVGIGMIYSPQNLIDFESKHALLPSLIKSKKAVIYIKELLNGENAVITDYNYKVYRCPKCGEFYERFFIHLDYDGGRFEVEYKCPKCKVALKSIDYNGKKVDRWKEKEINLEKYPCPKCGKCSLHEDTTVLIFWE